VTFASTLREALGSYSYFVEDPVNAFPAVLAEALIRWDWIGRNGDVIWLRTQEHVVLTVLPILSGTAIACPLALLATRYPRVYGPLLGVTGALFTIPSVAVFLLLGPFTGFLSRTTALIGLTVYTLLILLRNTVEGLRGVPAEVRESAEAMGYRPAVRLIRVELPLALPVIIAGLRIATVTTIGLVTITAVIAQGGYGQFFIDGYIRNFATPTIVGIVLSIGLAVAADVLLLGMQRTLTPWTRRDA
jgi:osmoprotectant transport system permease protein